METPLVSIVCLCYNHERFIEEAVNSVWQQTHKNIQLILVDDASTDSSVERIKALKDQYPAMEIILLPKNVGNCRAFNQGYARVKGDYIIDLAADDILLPARVEKGVKAFQAASPRYGVHFSDAEWIHEYGDHLFFHCRVSCLAAPRQWDPIAAGA